MILIRIKRPEAMHTQDWFELTVNNTKTAVWFLASLRAYFRPSAPHDCELHGFSKPAQRAVALQFGNGWENFSIKFPD